MTRLGSLLGAAALMLGAAVTPLMAKTPPGVLVVAKNIDDIVSLDPGQAYEFTGGEVVSQISSARTRPMPKM